MQTSEACGLFDRCLARRSSDDWREFIDTHDRRIRRTVRRAARRWGYQPDGADLDELVQDFYCRLVACRRRRFRGRTEDKLWTYLQRVASSLVIDHIRKLKAGKRWRNPTLDSFSPPDETAALRLRGRVSSEPSPETRCLRRELRGLFFDRCLEIVRRDRVKVELRALGMALLGGWTSREIAHRLSGRLSARQVDLLVHRLRRHLALEGIRLPRRPKARSLLDALA